MNTQGEGGRCPAQERGWQPCQHRGLPSCRLGVQNLVVEPPGVWCCWDSPSMPTGRPLPGVFSPWVTLKPLGWCPQMTGTRASQASRPQRPVEGAFIQSLSSGVGVAALMFPGMSVSYCCVTNQPEPQWHLARSMCSLLTIYGVLADRCRLWLAVAPN